MKSPSYKKPSTNANSPKLSSNALLERGIEAINEITDSINALEKFKKEQEAIKQAELEWDLRSKESKFKLQRAGRNAELHCNTIINNSNENLLSHKSKLKKLDNTYQEEEKKHHNNLRQVEDYQKISNSYLNTTMSAHNAHSLLKILREDFE